MPRKSDASKMTEDGKYMESDSIELTAPIVNELMGEYADV